MWEFEVVLHLLKPINKNVFFFQNNSNNNWEYSFIENEKQWV